MPRWLLLALVAAVLALVWAGHRHRPTPALGADGRAIVCASPPGFDDPDQPRQSPVAGRMPPFRLGAATVTPLAGFSLQARVLSREDYSLGREAAYSPTDLALGWGPMAAPGLADRLDVAQGGRWYRYRWGADGPPLPPAVIADHSANMHMVPADPQVARALAAVAADDIVRLDGWLIRIDRDDGWHWQSSTSRTDRGAGACELVYVCSIRVQR